MSIRGRRHNAETLSVTVEGVGPTLAAALDAAVALAFTTTPEALMAEISHYTFEVESRRYSTISNPHPTYEIKQVVAEVEMYLELGQPVKEIRRRNV